MLVVGGGINGAVSAAALAGRGASVALIDRGDFGGFTSQESSNLVWGGFKYLENYELPLVFELCRSRNRLMKAYPDNIKEITFLATLDARSPYRPWFAALGARRYWVIGLFGTRRPRVSRSRAIEAEEPAIDTSTARGGIEYHDAYLIDNDARFVFSFVRSALEAGASAANYVELARRERVGDRWVCRLRDTDAGDEFTTSARVIVNAAGPFVDELNPPWGLDDRSTSIVYSKGIHLVVPRLTTTRHDRVLAFFDDTRRLFYVIPMGRRSVHRHHRHPGRHAVHATVTDEDREFLLEQINTRLDLAAAAHRGRHHRRAVRRAAARRQARAAATTRTPTGPQLSRKHAIERDEHAHVVTVFGGKLTDCLNVGEEVADEVRGARRPARAGPAQLVRRAGARRPATSSTGRPG